MLHSVKIKQRFFEAKARGEKFWELRVNDRNYQIGDYIATNEIDDSGEYTGRFILEKIVDVNYPGDLPDGALEVGYVMLSTTPCFMTVGYNSVAIYGGEDT